MLAHPHEQANHVLSDVLARRARAVVDNIFLNHENCQVVDQHRLVVLDKEVVLVAIVVEHDACLRVETASRLPRRGVGCDGGKVRAATIGAYGRGTRKAGRPACGCGRVQQRLEAIAVVGRERRTGRDLRTRLFRGGLGQERPVAGVDAEVGTHRVVEVGKLPKHAGKDATDDAGEPIDSLAIDLARDAIEGRGDQPLDPRTVSTKAGNASRSRSTARRPALCCRRS
jgi:hypothetical protein